MSWGEYGLIAKYFVESSSVSYTSEQHFLFSKSDGANKAFIIVCSSNKRYTNIDGLNHQHQKLTEYQISLKEWKQSTIFPEGLKKLSQLILFWTRWKPTALFDGTLGTCNSQLSRSIGWLVNLTKFFASDRKNSTFIHPACNQEVYAPMTRKMHNSIKLITLSSSSKLLRN